MITRLQRHTLEERTDPMIPVIEAAEAAKIQLTAEEVARLEQLADATGIDTRGGWEHSME